MFRWDKLPNSRRIRKELKCINPMRDLDGLLKEYYLRKLRKVLGIIAVGVILSLLYVVKLKLENPISENGSIHRGEVGSGEKHLELEVVTKEGEVEEFSFLLGPRLYSEEEITKLFDAFIPELERIVLNGNISKDYINTDLVLPEAVEGYPFLVSWKSSDYTLVHWDGRVFYDSARGNQLVRLTANIDYEEYSFEHRMDICIVEPVVSEKTKWRVAIEEAWEEAEGSKSSKEVVLPSEIEGVSVSWRKKEDTYAWQWGIGILLLGGIVFFMEDVDLHKQVIKRRELLRDAYPMILHKLLLYLGAGLPIRGAFERIAKEYQGSNDSNPVKEEMLWSLGELQAGISEGVVYDNLGKRSGVKEYARLGTLLNQNLKRGNATLLERLKEENSTATAEYLQKRKKESEEAQTVLLLPMVMMLGIVLILIIVPAFMGMG